MRSPRPTRTASSPPSSRSSTRRGPRCTARAAPRPGRIERQLKAIVDDALPGKHVDVDDNLFDVGASSLTLIQIHEKIDELYPGAGRPHRAVRLPDVSQLAKHLEAKLGANA